MNGELIEIENEGIILQRTNYFDTLQAARGEFYLTWNAGCARLLVPDNQKHLIQEMQCEKVYITKLPDRIEILFDDLSDAPFQISIANEQNDRCITDGDAFLSVYVRFGEKYQFKAAVKGEVPQ